MLVPFRGASESLFRWQLSLCSRTLSGWAKEDATADAQSGEERLLRRWARIQARYEAAGPSSEATAGSQSTPGSMHQFQGKQQQQQQQLHGAQPRCEQHEHLQELLRIFGARLQGGLVPEQLSRGLVHFYRHKLRPQDRPWFFRLVCSELGLDVQQVSHAAAQWRQAVNRAESGGLVPAEALYRAADKLGNSTRPMYTQLLLPISQLEEGIGFLVRMRADLADAIKQQPAYSVPLRALSEHLRQALAGWFTAGLLQLHRVTWEGCSGELLEKVMKYEAVHPVSAWSDLQRRLEPSDRRVFTFMHPCLPGEPLVILHTALMNEPARSMSQIMQPPRQGSKTAPAGSRLIPGLREPGMTINSNSGGYGNGQGSNTSRSSSNSGSSSSSSSSSDSSSSDSSIGNISNSAADRSVDAVDAARVASSSGAGPRVAVFYSISSTQPGLSGVDLGNFLIKRVARVVQAELPSINLLVTLSPVPNFRSWLTGRLSYEAALQTDAAQLTRAAGNTAALSQASASSRGTSEGSQPETMARGEQGQIPPGLGVGTSPSSGSNSLASQLLLTDEEGRALLAAAWGLPPDQQSKVLSAAQLDTTAGGSPDPSSMQRSPATRPPASDLVELPTLTPKQRCRLLSAWLEGDMWQQVAEDARQGPLFRQLLMRLAARYLLLERRRNLALDPVANFHLRNGAELWRLNWGADSSERCMQQSFGIMVNYRYELDQVYQRNVDYLVKHKIAASQDVRQLMA